MIAATIALCMFTSALIYLTYLVCVRIWKTIYSEASFARRILEIRKYLTTNEKGLCEAAINKCDNPRKLIRYFRCKFDDAFPGRRQSRCAHWFKTHDERLQFLDGVLEDIKKDRNKEYSIYMACKL